MLPRAPSVDGGRRRRWTAAVGPSFGGAVDSASTVAPATRALRARVRPGARVPGAAVRWNQSPAAAGARDFRGVDGCRTRARRCGGGPRGWLAAPSRDGARGRVDAAVRAAARQRVDLELRRDPDAAWRRSARVVVNLPESDETARKDAGERRRDRARPHGDAPRVRPGAR